jgi:hypothetical protein
MTRQTDRLEVLAHDLASRYGEEDTLVQGVRAAIAQVPAPATAAFTPERRKRAQGPCARTPQAFHAARESVLA